MSDKRLVIFSDIHANLEALLAVMDDVRTYAQPDMIVNLGDVVGYGPDPVACIDIVLGACDLNLLGNHDYAVVHEAEGFNPIARGAVDYHRTILKPDNASGGDPDRKRRWRWLSELPPMHLAEHAEFMHASPRQPISEYVLPTDPELDPEKIDILFAAMTEKVAFVGHTHFPGVIEEGTEEFWVPDVLGTDGYVIHENRRALVNVGSVGQPRDRDPRACYVIFDGLRVEYRRVPYDFETTVGKIRDIRELHELCAFRLRDGR